MDEFRIQIPPKLIPVFLTEGIRYRGAYGGRGSAKSHTFAKMALLRGMESKKRILCARELQNSIKDSVHAELVMAIESEPLLKAGYEYGESYIRGKNGTEFLFKGLRHNYQQIKSTAGVDICWVEEAETVSEQSWMTLIPTVTRNPHSEIWLTWNPESEDSATKRRFLDSPPSDCMIVKMNYMDNPWFPAGLEAARIDDHKYRPDIYGHIWEGECVTRTDAQILSGKYRVEEFTPGDWDGPYYGLDFGFSQDPTAAVKCWVNERKLYIEYEAGKVGLELDQTSSYLKQRVPEIEKHAIRADSARPESISYLKRKGLPRIEGVQKWKGSVEDGIAHIRGYECVVIHPRCAGTIREARLYSYKIDRMTGDVMPVIVDANNHYMDAIRYAINPLIQRTGGSFLSLRI